MPRIQLLFAFALMSICTSCGRQPASGVAPTTADGHAAFAAGNDERAIEIYTNVLSKNPGDSAALRGRGAAFQHKGDYDQALVDLNSAIEIDGDDPIAFNNRAYVSRELGHNEAAIADFEKAIELGYDNADLRHTLAMLFAAADRFEEAVRQCNAAIDFDPNDVTFYMNRGAYCVELGQFEAAVEDFTTATKLAPENYAPWALRYKAHMHLGERDKARRDGETAHRLNPDWSMPEPYASFPGVGLKLLMLDGFEIAENFHGFQHLESQSSVLAMLIPGPFSESTEGFTADGLKSRGVILRGKEEVEIEGLPGLLLDATQEAHGISFAKWILAFGDDRETRLVTATFPISLEVELSIPLRLVVLSAKLDESPPPSPATEVGFTIAASPELKLTRGIGKLLMYTKDGIIPSKSPDDPLFIAAPSVSTLQIVDKRQFAVQRLFQTAETKIASIISNEEVTIDGLSGFEIVADAENADRGTPLTVYQVILYDDGAYILMQGLVTRDAAATYLPEFKKDGALFLTKTRHFSVNAAKFRASPSQRSGWEGRNVSVQRAFRGGSDTIHFGIHLVPANRPLPSHANAG